MSLIRIELPQPSSIPFFSRSVLVTNRSSPTSCTLSPSSAVSFCQPSQSSSSSASSMEMMGYLSTSFFQCPISSSEVNLVPAFGSTYSPFFSPFHSLEAASMAITKSFPGSYPALLTASRMYSMASSSLARSGAKPPSSPTEVASPLDFNSAASAWNTSAHQRRPSLKLGAPAGMIMNSCTSTVLAAWAPPFKIFIMGTGRRFPFIPPRKRYSGISSAMDAARAQAMETARMAFAPSFDLSFVPSAAIIAASTA